MMLMRKIGWWLTIVIFFVIVFWLIGDQSGHVTIVRTPYRIQFSFNFFLVAIVLSFIVLHYFFKLVSYLKKLPSRWKFNQETKQFKSQQSALIESLQALINDDFAKAEKAAKKALVKNKDNIELDKIIADLTQKQTKTSIQNTDT